METLRGDMNYATAFEFRVEDGATLQGIPDDSIQAVVSMFAAFLIPNRDQMFSAIQRVSSTGALFATSAWTALPAELNVVQVRNFHSNGTTSFSRFTEHMKAPLTYALFMYSLRPVESPAYLAFERYSPDLGLTLIILSWPLTVCYAPKRTLIQRKSLTGTRHGPFGAMPCA